jgi:hypothetical protein
MVSYLLERVAEIEPGFQIARRVEPFIAKDGRQLMTMVAGPSGDRCRLRVAIEELGRAAVERYSYVADDIHDSLVLLSVSTQTQKEQLCLWMIDRRGELLQYVDRARNDQRNGGE